MPLEMTECAYQSTGDGNAFTFEAMAQNVFHDGCEVDELLR